MFWTTPLCCCPLTHNQASSTTFPSLIRSIKIEDFDVRFIHSDFFNWKSVDSNGNILSNIEMTVKVVHSTLFENQDVGSSNDIFGDGVTK